MKILFLCHEQRMHYSMEPAYFELVLPLSKVDGIECITYPYQRISSITDVDQRDFLLDSMYKDIKCLCQLYKPDIIFNALTWHNECIPGYILRKIRDLCDNLVTVFFDHDESNALMLNDERDFFENSKLNIFVDSPNRVKRINENYLYSNWENKKSAYFKPLPIDDNIFKCIEHPLQRVAIIGSQEGFRIEVINFLKSQKLLNIHTAGSILDSKDFLPIEQYACEIYSSLINIVTSTQTYRSQIKGRSFQVISTGTCLLEQENEDNANFFNSEYIFFWRSYEDLLCGIDLIQSNPKLHLEKSREYRIEMQKFTLPSYWIRDVFEKVNSA